MNDLLSVRNLHASYGKTRVLHGIDMHLKEGSITALLGANGAGKTTMLRALCQMMVTTSDGSIELDGKRADGRSTEQIVRMGVAHVPDGRGTFHGLSTEENMKLGAYLRDDKSAVKADFERMYAYFPRLKERRAQQAGTLSGGEQQMLAIARALMSRPRLLLMDEPSFGLAPLIVEDLFGIIRRINREDKVSILLVEQNALLALEVADSAYLLETGRIVLAGSAQDMRNNDAVRRVYLGE
ncbi:MAG: ABC transporter ATP-binding protein [Pseudomonadota bacterium]